MRLEADIGGRSVRLGIRAVDGAYVVEVDGRPLHVEASFEGALLSLAIDGHRHELGVVRRGSAFLVSSPVDQLEVAVRDAARPLDASPHRGAKGPARVMAPMPGKIVRVMVSQGQTVAAGAGLVVVEAMKMENELRAPRAGVVLDLRAREGQAVESGALLAVVG
jgi:biotin carboxyl carrier protein